MTFAALLYSLLKAGATLMAEGAAGEFAKGAGKSAWEALKTRLAGQHSVAGLDALDKPAFADPIKAELEKPDIAADPEIARLAEALRAALATLPKAQTARYAVDVQDAIESVGHMSLEDIEGIRTKSLKSGGNMTLKGIKAPPGK
jgi:hypothetical protein